MASLSVKYRPTTFDECVGQESVIAILKKQIELKEFKNSYIFSGKSGCGKTTTARIFSKLINGGIGTPIEIDAASNNGVDNVRDIVNHATERALDGEYKIYILDEAHMFTIQAWNAFLKCIEEPPKYTIFIFCTTDPQKIPATILNRCMQFNFNKISNNKICYRLETICKNEGFTNYQDSIKFISKISKGQMRDAIANLEKVSAYDKNLNINSTLSILGNYSYDIMFSLINAFIDANEMTVLQICDYIYNESMDIKVFVDQLLTFCLDAMKYSLFHNFSTIDIPDSMENDLIRITNFADSNKYYSYVVDKLLGLKNMIKTDTNPYNTCEVVLLQICRCQ